MYTVVLSAELTFKNKILGKIGEGSCQRWGLGEIELQVQRRLRQTLGIVLHLLGMTEKKIRQTYSLACFEVLTGVF